MLCKIIIIHEKDNVVYKHRNKLDISFKNIKLYYRFQ